MMGEFDSMEELCDCAADSEVKPDGNKPQQQQSHQQQMQSGESSQSCGKKCNFQLSVSELAEAPKPHKSMLDRDDKVTGARWVALELYETRTSEGKCICPGLLKHTTFR